MYEEDINRITVVFACYKYNIEICYTISVFLVKKVIRSGFKPAIGSSADPATDSLIIIIIKALIVARYNKNTGALQKSIIKMFI